MTDVLLLLHLNNIIFSCSLCQTPHALMSLGEVGKSSISMDVELTGDTAGCLGRGRGHVGRVLASILLVSVLT